MGAKMGTCRICGETHHVGFISTRLAGTDGVSLEAEKWAHVFEKEGFACFYLAGKLDRPDASSYLLKEAHFKHPDIKDIYLHCFGVQERGRYITQKIHQLKEIIKDHLYQFIEKFKIQLLVIENALTIPLNLPLGIAITEVISEIGMPTVAHHHDFFWERQHFMTNAVWEYLNMAFPPHLPSIHHTVINSSGDNQLSLRTGISAHIIPNVMDFENPPEPLDEYASDVRQALGVIGDHTAIDTLTDLMKDRTVADSARAQATTALGLIGEDELLPVLHVVSVDNNYRAMVDAMQELLTIT